MPGLNKTATNHEGQVSLHGIICNSSPLLPKYIHDNDNSVTPNNSLILSFYNVAANSSFRVFTEPMHFHIAALAEFHATNITTP